MSFIHTLCHSSVVILLYSEPRSILVQAFGHPSVPSNVVTFTIEVQPTPNSPMVVMVNPQRTDPLEDYLASNVGFNVSFLLSEDNVR